MKTLSYLFLAFFLILTFSACDNKENPHNQKLELNSGWFVNYQDSLYAVDLPWNALSFALEHQWIEDPNFGPLQNDHGLDLNAISLVKTFELSEKDLAFQNQLFSINSEAENLKIIINDKDLGLVNTLDSEITLHSKLKKGKNNIEIKCLSTETIAYENININSVKLSFSDGLKSQKPYLAYQEMKNDSLLVQWNLPIEVFEKGPYKIDWEFEGKTYRVEPTLDVGKQLTLLQFPIIKPRFWMPANQGKPERYEGQLTFWKDDKLLEKKPLTFGINHLEWRNNNNQIQFVLNSKPIKVLALNHEEKTRLNNTSFEEFKTQIDLMKILGFNCLRLNSEQNLSETQLNYLDEIGLLVWKDLPFTTLPKQWNTKALTALQQEALFLSERYRNHPSVLSFGGLAEQRDTNQDSGLIHYEIFEQRLPKLFQTFSDVPYIPNTHFVWNDEPFDWKSTSMSSYEFLDVWMTEKQRDPYAETWTSRFQNFDEAEQYYESLFDFYGMPIDLESMIYYSEIRQSQYIDQLLSKKKHQNPNVIHLPLSISEANAGVNPSITDHYNYKKAVFYSLKKHQNPLVVETQINDEKSWVYKLNNNSDSSQNIGFQLVLKDGKGKMIHSEYHDIKFLPYQTKAFFTWHEDLVPEKWKASEQLILEIKTNNFLERKLIRFTPNQVPYADYKFKTETGKLKFITNSFMPFTKFRTMHLGYFESNFIHLMPGDTSLIPFRSEDQTREINDKGISSLTFYQSFEE
ncbi:MAG: hypothetical protein ACPGTG_06075 [Flavobacteriales bacterium]